MVRLLSMVCMGNWLLKFSVMMFVWCMVVVVGSWVSGVCIFSDR